MSIKALTKCDGCDKIEECHIHQIQTLNSELINLYYCDKCNPERVEPDESDIDW